MANYVKSVKELILDEQKLVTYVSLCKELCIHVNESKALLSQTVEQIKEKQPDITINVNFIISGLLDDHSARTLVCSEAELDTEKARFRTVFFVHIYSVSQGLAGIDNAALVSLNRFEDLPLCKGLIKSNSCTKRTSDEIESLKSKSVAAFDVQATTAAPKKVLSKNIIHNGTDNAKSVVKAHAAKSEPVIKTEVISPKKSSACNGKINNTNGKKTSKDIAGFFSKANSAPTIKPTKITQENDLKKAMPMPEEKKVKEEIKIEEMDVDVEDVPDKTIKAESTNALKSTSNKNNSYVNKRENKIKKTAKVDKKRKRVLHVSDSESDEDPFADNKPALQESDDEIPPTPSTNTIKITSGILNPKKRRKVVDKTYTDEDGYILTRKEEVYESCSEDEVVVIQPDPKVEKENKINTEVSPPKEKEKKTKNMKKKISPPQKGKQTTMTNFFKKH